MRTRSWCPRSRVVCCTARGISTLVILVLAGSAGYPEPDAKPGTVIRKVPGDVGFGENSVELHEMVADVLVGCSAMIAALAGFVTPVPTGGHRRRLERRDLAVAVDRDALGRVPGLTRRTRWRAGTQVHRAVDEAHAAVAGEHELHARLVRIARARERRPARRGVRHVEPHAVEGHVFPGCHRRRIGGCEVRELRRSVQAVRNVDGDRAVAGDRLRAGCTTRAQGDLRRRTAACVVIHGEDRREVRRISWHRCVEAGDRVLRAPAVDQVTLSSMPSTQKSRVVNPPLA